MIRVLKALGMAAWGHRRQRDKGGRAYLWHLLVVAWVAWGLTRDSEAAVLGLLHDYVEDLDDGAWLRVRDRFGMETAMRVSDVTRRSGEQYPAYIGRVAGRGRVVLAVKLADLLHNSDGARRHGAQGESGRMQRYLNALNEVSTAWATQPGGQG